MRPVVLACLVALALPICAASQSLAVISGAVTDAATGEGVRDVNIFLSGSMVGTSSANDGGYVLSGVPLGASRLVVSRVGYTAQTHDILIRKTGRYGQDFVLEEQIVQVGEIVVMGDRDEEWVRDLRRFERLFIGASESAQATTILNPEVLSFDEVDGRLFATAQEPLIIESGKLGYRIDHHLYSFASKGNETRQEGEAYFAKMTPEDAGQEKKWAEAREKAYRGSPQHFLRAAIADRLREEGFYVYRASDPKPYLDEGTQLGAAPSSGFAVGPKFFLSPADEPGEFRLSFPAYLEIVFTEERESRAYRRWQRMPQTIDLEYQRSWITLDRDFVIVDAAGNVLDPQGMIYFGFMAFERVGDAVPREYGLQ